MSVSLLRRICKNFIFMRMMTLMMILEKKVFISSNPLSFFCYAHLILGCLCPLIGNEEFPIKLARRRVQIRAVELSKKAPPCPAGQKRAFYFIIKLFYFNTFLLFADQSESSVLLGIFTGRKNYQSVLVGVLP